jgi:hypothetical protein
MNATITTQLSKEGIYISKIVERLQAITKATISNHLLFTKRGDKYTIKFYNCDDCKYYKATLEHKCLIGNIRESK